MNKWPHIYVIAGPNGAGKTTFAREFLPIYAKCSTFVNADLIAGGLSPFSPEAAALKAGRLLLEQIESFAKRRIDFAFETTLSGVTYLAKLAHLRKAGYRIHLFFLWIPDVKLSLARVANRVKMGGHGISERVVRRRFHKGLRNFFRRYRFIADSWMFFDNSGSTPRVIAKQEMGVLTACDEKLYRRVLERAEGK